MSKNFTEFLPVVRDNLKKIETRLYKVVQKQERNPLLLFFSQQPEEPESSTAVTFSQLALLRDLSPGLYQFATDLS